MPILRRLLHSTLFWTLIAALAGAGGMLIFLRVAPNALPASGNSNNIRAALDALGLPVRILASAGIWAVFGVYWSLAARGAAAPQQAESRGSRSVHVGLTILAQLVVLLPVPGLRARLVPLTMPLSTPLVAAGFAVQIAGLLLSVWARQTLGRLWSGAIATNTDHQLIRSGPYRFVRHPIYTAILGLYLGTALISGELHGLVGLALAVAAIAYWRLTPDPARAARAAPGRAAPPGGPDLRRVPARDQGAHPGAVLIRARNRVHSGFLANRAKHPPQSRASGPTGPCGCFAPTLGHQRRMHPGNHGGCSGR